MFAQDLTFRGFLEDLCGVGGRFSYLSAVSSRNADLAGDAGGEEGVVADKDGSERLVGKDFDRQADSGRR